MLASFVITFREFLEAALVVVIVLSYLKRTGQAEYYRNVWTGVGIGAALSVALAAVFGFLLGGFTGNTEKVFEGVTMLFAVVLLTWMIVWMMFQKNAALELESKVERHVGKNYAIGITVLVAVAVLREGVEMVIFLKAVSLSGGADLTGALAGAWAGITLGYMTFAGIRKIRLKTFFRVTGVVLILFAAGLASHAFHEFEEAGLVSPVVPRLYDISWLIDKKGFLGGVMNSLFGYTGKPSLTEMTAYIGYLAFAYILYRSVGRRAGEPQVIKDLKESGENG